MKTIELIARIVADHRALARLLGDHEYYEAATSVKEHGESCREFLLAYFEAADEVEDDYIEKYRADTVVTAEPVAC